jgi:hypothetical protein
MVIGAKAINVVISAGLAVSPRDGTDAEALLQRAVAAMAWSVGIAVVAYLWARRLYNRDRAQ